MSCGVLGLLPCPAPTEEGYEEEGTPEHKVGGGQDLQDPYTSHSLFLDLPGDELEDISVKLIPVIDHIHIGL